MDDSSRRELGLPPRCVPSSMLTTLEQGPSAGSYPANEPGLNRTSIVLDYTQTS